MEGRPSVDVHSHFIPDAYWGLIERRAQGSSAFAEHARRNNLIPQPVDAPMRRLDLRLAEMAAAGVGISVLTLPPPALTLDALSGSAVEEVNDALVVAAGSDPRLRAFISVPLPDVDMALNEVRRLGDHPKVVGVAITTNSRDFGLDEPALETVYRAVAERGLPLFLHPALEPTAEPYWRYGLAASLAPVVNSTLGTLHLILSGMLDRVVQLRLIMPHLGGLIPYLLQRIEDLSGSGEAARPVREYLRERFMFDTCSMHEPALRCAIDTIGVDRLLLGTDYPFRGAVGRSVDHIRNADLSAAEVDAILADNAVRALPRLLL